MERTPFPDRSRRMAGKVALLYMLIAGGWIALSDAAVHLLAQDPGQAQLLQTLKAALFVVVTGGALYWIVRRQLARFERSHSRGRLLEAAVEATGDTVLVTDADGAIAYANPAFERITGYRLEEVRGMNPRILKSGRQPEEFYDRMWGILQGGRTFEGEFVNRRKDGSLYWKAGTITPVPDEHGRPLHFIDVSRDVTEQRRLERQLREAQKVALLGHVSGGIAHDCRNMLGVIQAHTDLALQVCDEGRLPRGELEGIAGAVRHGSELLKAFLSLGRKGELEFQALPLADVVEETRTTLRAVFPSTVEIEVETERGLVANLDPGSVHQMILNLATNARDAMPEGGRFRLRSTRARGPTRDDNGESFPDTSTFPDDGIRREGGGSWIELEASDSGAGMDEETRKRVFEPLFTTKPPERGTGLGMSMVARLMQDHGGRVIVESAPEAGTTVRLLFPRVSAEEVDEDGPPAPTETAGPVPRGSETILVVEDEAPLREALSRSLERLGYRALTAEHGLEALDRLGTERVDLVITDLVMPRMGGRELSDEMRLLGWFDLPVIFVSGYQVHEMEAAPEGASDVHFLEKPWTISELAHKVHNVLDLQRLHA